mgnify:CR=1 FL=1
MQSSSQNFKLEKDNKSESPNIGSIILKNGEEEEEAILSNTREVENANVETPTKISRETSERGKGRYNW